MGRKEVRHGMKVVPFDKTPDGRVKGLENSAVWRDAQIKKQPFLYVTKIRFTKNGNDYPEVLLDSNYNSNTGDYFLVTDFNRYKKQ